MAQQAQSTRCRQQPPCAAHAQPTLATHSFTVLLGSRAQNSTVQCREAEATATLNTVATAACLLVMFLVQRLGLALSEAEVHRIKEATLIKQVGLLGWRVGP